MSIKMARRSVASFQRTPRGAAAPSWAAGINWQWIVDSGTFTATTGSTTNAKSAWQQMIASTSATSAVMLILPQGLAVASTDTSALIDIGVGASGSESVIVPNVACGGYTTTSWPIYVPIRVPSGSRVSFRAQSVQATKAVQCRVHLLSALNGDRLPTSVDTIGTSTATSTGVALSGSSGTYVEVTSATTRDYQALCVVPSSSATAGNNGGWRLQLGVGAAGSEVEIGACHVEQTGNPFVQTSGMYQPQWNVFSQFIPTGTRVAIKHNITSNPGRLSVCVIGVPYP
jgi:hypothetical protein